MNIVLLGPKGAGRNFPPPIAPVQHANGEQPLRLAAAIDDEGNPNYQGWMPDRNPHKAASVKDDPAVSNNSATAPAASTTEDEGNPNYQGWSPTGNLLKPANLKGGPFEGNNSVTAPAASSTEDEGNQNYQGWLPTRNAVKAASTKSAPSLANGSDGSASAPEEGNPNFQGYTPDWAPPEPGGSIRGSMPRLPGPAIGMHQQ